MPRYPTDGRGVPLPVAEVGIPYLESSRWNNHHLSYYRKAFARTAISQTFRDLDRFQEVMPIRSHVLLHKRFGGIALPAAGVMLGEIEDAKDLGETLKIYNLGSRQYENHAINDERLALLKAEYDATDATSRVFV